MNIQKGLIVEGASGRSFLMDAYWPVEAERSPVVVFAHGFKGFKDWGCWHLVAEQFMKAGFVFIKFNFSHNGTTLDKPLDFADLEAFGQNNYSKELEDTEAVLNWVHQPANWPRSNAVDLNQISLIGHSRGGGISIIKAAKDQRIKALVTWASVATLDYSWRDNEEYISNWAKDGVVHILNGRTQQMMPLYYQLFEDFQTHSETYSTQKALQMRPDLPTLIIHGTADPAVPAAAASTLKDWHPHAELELIEDANHVFGGQHPYPVDASLPTHLKIVVEKSVTFLKSLTKL